MGTVPYFLLRFLKLSPATNKATSAMYVATLPIGVLTATEIEWSERPPTGGSVMTSILAVPDGTVT